jgi:hypothetical protein
MEASQLSGFTPDHIRKLIRKREIDGIKIGRNWLTTREAIRNNCQLFRRTHPGYPPNLIDFISI